MKRYDFLEDYIYTPSAQTYAESLETAIKLINADRQKDNKEYGYDINRKYILFVPDKYTLCAEKLMFGNAGSFNCEVLTLNRLYYKLDAGGVNKALKPISRMGAILTVRRILGDISDSGNKLKCFNTASKYPGFGKIVYDYIYKMEASGIRAADIPTDVNKGVTALKLGDVKRIYGEYEKATLNKYVDSPGRLLLAEELIESSEFLKGANVYFACYDHYTSLAARVIYKICKTASRAVIVNTKMLDFIAGAENKTITEYAASSRAAELKAAAVRIRKYALEGAKYGDMGVIAPGADFNRLKRIFDEFDIPFFTDSRYALSSHPLAVYILNLFAAAGTKSNENYIRLSKNPYTHIPLSHSDEFENYINFFRLGEWAVERGEFTLSNAEAGYLCDTPENVRKRLIKLVKSVNIEDIKTGADLFSAVKRLIADCDTEDISDRYSAYFPSAAKEILSATEVIAEVYCAPTRRDKLLDALKECFALKQVGVIPNRYNTVEVGDASAFRACRKKYMFVLGMHDGEIPELKRDEGLILDSEAAGLLSDGTDFKIEPKTEDINEYAEAELYSVLSASENLFLSYCEDCAPSSVITKLRAWAEKKNRYNKTGDRIERSELINYAGSFDDRTALEEDSLAGENKAPKSYGRLLDMCPTREAALELRLTGENEIRAGGLGIGFEPELKEATLGAKEYYSQPDEIECAPLIYNGKKISISRVQEYFACPLRCFFKYGIALREKPDGKLSVADTGSLLHLVMDRYMKKRNQGVLVPATDIIRSIAEENPAIIKGISPEFLNELTQEITRIIEIVEEQIESGEFEPLYSELPFGFYNSVQGLKGITEQCKFGSIKLDGIIDRMDILDNGCGKESKGAVRIVDYKTGSAEFSLSDIYYGRKIQLPIYMNVAEYNGYYPAGMFYFPFSSGFEEDEFSYRMNGMFDKNYAGSFDFGLYAPEYASKVIAAKSSKNSSEGGVELEKRNKSSAVSAEMLEAVCNYAKKVLIAGAEEMLEGYCAPAPLSGKRDECQYCAYKAACLSYGGEKRERVRESISPEFFYKED